MLYTQVSRKVPLPAIWCCRNTPSNFAPSRSMAARLCILKKWVRNSTAMQFKCSQKSWMVLDNKYGDGGPRTLLGIMPYDRAHHLLNWNWESLSQLPQTGARMCVPE